MTARCSACSAPGSIRAGPPRRASRQPRKALGRIFGHAVRRGCPVRRRPRRRTRFARRRRGHRDVLSLITAVPEIGAGGALRRQPRRLRASARRRAPGHRPGQRSRTARSRPNASPGAARGRASPPPSSSPSATTSTTTSSRSARRRSAPARAAHPLRGEGEESGGVGEATRREERVHGRRHQPEHEPKLREAFEYAHVHNNTVLIDRRTKWGNNPFRIGPDGTRDRGDRALPRRSLAPHPRRRDRAGGARRDRGMLVRVLVSSEAVPRRGAGPRRGWAAGVLAERDARHAGESAS